MILLQLLVFPASATVGFSQANYSLIEGGGPVSVCLVVLSLTGQLAESIFVGLTTPESRLTGEFTFVDETQVGDQILCQTLTFSDDNVVERRPDFVLSSFVEAASPSITSAPERDTAILRFVDNDRTFLIINIMKIPLVPSSRLHCAPPYHLGWYANLQIKYKQSWITNL